MPAIDYARTVWDYLLARLDIDADREEGLTTTEIAVITLLLVGAAIFVMNAIFQAAKTNINNIPEPRVPTAS